MKTYCILQDDSKTVEKFLLTHFPWSKQFYKKQKFPPKWLDLRSTGRLELEIPLHCLNHGKISCGEEDSINEKLILQETDRFVAIYKKQNIHSHPLGYGETNNVLSQLRQIGRVDLLNINLDSYDRGLLYRLDFETSGLLITAKFNEDYQQIRKNFNHLMKRKVYMAKCMGKFAKDRGDLVHFIKPIGIKNHKMQLVQKPNEDAVLAKLSYEVLSYNPTTEISEVKIFLETGHRHQIRVQFSSIGHPLLGDELYGGLKADRLYLHAKEYEFSYLDRINFFEAPLPIDW